MGEAPGTGDLGRRGFVERVKGRIRGAGSKREQPSVRRFESRDLKSVLKIVAGYFNLPQEKLVGRRTEWRDERAIAMELMYRYGGVSQPEVSKVMGDLDYTAVSRERKRLREKIKTERGLKAALDEIGTSLMPQAKDLTWTPLCPNTCTESAGPTASISGGINTIASKSMGGPGELCRRNNDHAHLLRVFAEPQRTGVGKYHGIERWSVTS